MKNKELIILLLTLFMLGFCACQPTPENDVVIQRDNTEKEVIKSSEEDGEIVFSYEVPGHVTDRFTVIEDKLDIVIDADVNMPQIDSVPVAKIISDPFTQERADELLKYFMQDGVLVTPKVHTKSDYDEWIILAKQEYSERESDADICVDGVEWIEYLMQERENAPEEYIPEEIKDYSIYQEGGLVGRILVNDEETGHLRITENIFQYYRTGGYRMAADKIYDENENVIETPQKELDFTAEEAEDIASGYLAEMGIEDMVLIEAEKMYFFEDGGSEYEIDYGGYAMTFVREFGGMKTMTDECYGMSQNDKYDVSPPVNKEMMEIYIDENGNIAHFFWYRPVKVVETLTEHVDILSFDEMMLRLEEFSKIQFKFMEDYYVDGMIMIKYIYDISLKLNYLPIKNNPTEFMLAPCWVFTYKDTEEYTDEKLAYMESIGVEPIGMDEMGDMMMIFSAVDGASVSGYTSNDYEEYIDYKEK